MVTKLPIAVSMTIGAPAKGAPAASLRALLKTTGEAGTRSQDTAQGLQTVTRSCVWQREGQNRQPIRAV